MTIYPLLACMLGSISIAFATLPDNFRYYYGDGSDGESTSFIDLSYIGDPDNPTDDHGHGDVMYPFFISQTEITNKQYATFLNAVANKTDNYGLWHPSMSIDKLTADGISFYISQNGTENFPVTFVDVPTAMRFANWLENGMPTSFEKPQDLSDATEKGAYNLNRTQGLSHNIRLRDTGFAITNLDEWTKAAYYNPDTQSYSDYLSDGFDHLTLNCCASGSNLLDVNTLPQEGYYKLQGLSGNALEWTEDFIPQGTHYKDYTDKENLPAAIGGRFVRGSAYNIDETTERSYLHRSRYKVKGEGLYSVADHVHDARSLAGNTGFRIVYRESVWSSESSEE